MFEGFLLIFRVEKHPGHDFFDVYYLSEAKNRAPVSTLSIEKNVSPFEPLFIPINSRLSQISRYRPQELKLTKVLWSFI